MLMPLFFFLRFNKIGIIVLAAALVLGYTIQSFLGDYITLMEVSDAVDNKIETYINSDSYMETSKSIVGYIISIITYGYAIVSLWYVKTGKVQGRLLRLEPLMMLFLFYAMIGIGLPIAYRFVRFYIIYYILFVSEFIVYLFRLDGRLGRDVIYAKALAIMFPFFFMIARERFKEETWVRYHPYSSIFEQKLDGKRENQYSIYEGDPPVLGKY
jgi:hypothetical protein